MGNGHRYIQNLQTGKLEGRIQINDNRTNSSEGQRKIEYIQDPKTGLMNGSRKSSDNSTDSSKEQKDSKSIADNVSQSYIKRRKALQDILKRHPIKKDAPTHFEIKPSTFPGGGVRG
jgi:hypothetical protein